MWKNDPEQLEKDLIKKTILVAIIPCLTALLLREVAGVASLALGLFVSFLLLRLRRLNIERALKMSKAKAEAYIRNRYFINYIIYLAILFAAYKNPHLNVIATAIGLLLIKYVILGLAVIDIIQDKWSKRMNKFKEGGRLNEY